MDGAERPRPRRADHRHRRGHLRPGAVGLGAAARGRPGQAAGTPRSGTVEDRDAFVEDVRQALYASKVVAYSQGFDQIAAASAEYGWNIDRGAMARIWRGGCIIRARFLNRITEAYEREPELAAADRRRLLRRRGRHSLPAWRRIVAGAARNGIPTPAFSSSLAYYDGMRAERLPAALIQGQRDFFGAHTYRRVDKAACSTPSGAVTGAKPRSARSSRLTMRRRPRRRRRSTRPPQ